MSPSFSAKSRTAAEHNFTVEVADLPATAMGLIQRCCGRCDRPLADAVEFSVIAG